MTEAGMTMTGKRVVIVGGASGIGFAVAELAHASGAEIVIGSSSAGNVKAATDRLSSATGHVVNLRDESSVSGFFEEVGSFDHLVITAGDWGIPMFASLQDLDLQSAHDIFTVRFWGALAAAKYAAAKISQSGSITLTGGMLTHRPMKGAPVATAMGGAVEYLTRGLAMDLAPVRVNAVSPGMILTEVVKQRPEEMLQAMVAHLPIPRCASPREAAMAYVYLMLNDYTTGQVLPVDGGGHIV